MILVPTPDNIAQAAQVIQSGGVVGVPTETVYGLAGSIASPESIASIFRRKRRPQDNPLIVHISSLEQAALLTTEDGLEIITRCNDLFWPGPLTVVVPCSSGVPTSVTAGLDTVAIRMPAHAVFRHLIECVDSPLAAPSANVSGHPSPTTAEHVQHDHGQDLLILDGGPCLHGIESTVVRFADDTIYVLRPGAIELDRLYDLGVARIVPSWEAGSDDRVRSPGIKYRHYAPHARVILCYSIEEAKEQLHRHIDGVVGLVSEYLLSEFEALPVRPLKVSTVFDEMRRADAMKTATIVVLCDQTVVANHALINRLLKSAG